MAKLPSSVVRAFRGAATRYHSAGSRWPHDSLGPLLCSFSAAVAPCSSSIHSIQSSSSTFSHARSASTQAPLMRVQQQQQDHHDGSSSSSRTSWGKLLAGGAAAAAAGAAGWAVWSESDAARRMQAAAEESNRAGLPRCSVGTQHAVVSCYAGPLIYLLHGTSPTPAQLQEITSSVTQDASLLTPWELVNSLWGFAMFGADINQQQTQALAAAAASQMPHMTVYQAVVATWALMMLCSSMEQLCSSSWLQLLSRLQESGLQEYDEGAVLYLLHAAMQRAALQDQAAAGALPRASEQEVLQLLGQLPKAVKARVAAAYKEYVPFQQYIEGPFLVIMHILKALPSQINAAAAAAGDSSSSSSSPYQVAYGGFSAADADAASTLVANGSLLSKLRRNLYFGWRSDELLDRHQDNLNQVIHVLSRRLMLLPVQQSPDIDVLLPSLKAALLLDDDLSPAAALPGSSSSSSSSSSQSRSQQQQHSDAPTTSISYSPGYSVAYLASCHDALSVLMRNRYGAPPGGFQGKSTPGIRAAKARCLQQRVWQVVHVRMSEVEACMAGASAGAAQQRRKPRDVAAGHVALEELLRARLKNV